jgi:VWFA-related protein
MSLKNVAPDLVFSCLSWTPGLLRSVTGAALIAAAATVAAQQAIPRFKSGVDVVQFTVTVLDKDRHPITGLAASDFEVLVDGQPKPLAAFAAVTLPDDPSVAAASIPPVAPDVQTNQVPAEGRLVVIVMDRSIRDDDMKTAHAIANAAIDRLGPNDIAAVVYTGRASRKYSQGLTADRARLHAAANLLSVGDMQAAPSTPTLAGAIASRGAPQKIDQLERSLPLASEERSGECDCGICVVDSLTALAKSLTGAMGREKSILYVGSDIAIASQVARTDTRDFGRRCSAYIYPARDKLTRALDAANVTFHVIDPHGLDPAEGDYAFRVTSLAVLPDETGGRTVINNNRPEEKIGAIFDESRAYYVLAVGRDPAATKDDDKHKIKITVRRPDAIVNARNLYFAADSKEAARRAPNAAAGALNELLPGGDFTLEMNLVPQFAADGTPEIRVLFGADSAIAGKLDVLIRAYDRVFTPVGEPIKQRLDVPGKAVAGSATFQWTSVLKAPPGDYEVRAAVATADGRHAANVIGYIDVPDVKKGGLALSGVTVKSGGAVTVQRQFGAGAAMGLSFQVARERRDAPAVTVRYSLRDDVGQQLVSADVPHERAVAVSPNVDAYDLGVRLPGAPGRYVATIEASDGNRVVRRAVLVTVH